MKIASVDIGTNAVKSKIFETTPTSIKFIDGIRSPIRLGAEVFEEASSIWMLPVSPVKNINEVLDDQQYAAMKGFHKFFHPEG